MEPPQVSRSDVDDILRRKRKVREHKACYPCRQRKVRCDSQIPCKTCKERNHPELCAFNPPEKRVDTGSKHVRSGSSHEGVAMERDDWDRLASKLNNVERTLADLKDDLHHVVLGHASPERNGDTSPAAAKEENEQQASGPRHVRNMEINEQSHLTGENIHLGGGSVPALVMALGKSHVNRPAVKEVVEHSVLSLFGLDNTSATYPFVSLWGGPQAAAQRVSELSKTLPSDAECLDFWRHYRDGAYVTYPAIVEVDKFESELLQFLMQRNNNATSGEEGTSADTIHGMNLQWVGLLYAALASGVQFSNLPKKDRELASQVYICCSFECLRLINWLSNASVDVIQTLIVIGNVLSNGMNAGVAWSLLGLTTRLAQSLGFHRASDISNPTPKDVVRSKTWWAVLWQDSMLSLSYDRAPSAAVVDCKFPENEPNSRGGRTYPECMYRLCKIGLDIVRNRVANQTIESRLDRCGDLRKGIETMQSQAADHLRDCRKAVSMKDQSEYWALYLHSSFMLSELCRPAISPSIAAFDATKELRGLCILHLMNTVDAFLGLVAVSPVYHRSWSAVHRVLSSGLLLGILGESLRNARAQNLLTRLVTVMADASSAAMDLPDLSAPIARSISALRKLNAPESRTPRQVDEPQQLQQQPQSDPQSQQQQQQQMPQIQMPQDVLLPQQQQQQQQPQQDPNNMFSADSLNAFNFDNAAFYLPSPLSGFEDESSPYALMDSIIWGGLKTPS